MLWNKSPLTSSQVVEILKPITKWSATTIVKNSIKIDIDPINATINQCKAKLNINRDIPVVLTSDVSIPSLLGFTKPILLLPKDMLGKISNDQLKHIILHELSHYKKKDNVVNCIFKNITLV